MQPCEKAFFLALLRKLDLLALKITKTSSQYVWIYVIYNLIICYFISILGYCVTDLILWVFPVLMVSCSVKLIKDILQILKDIWKNKHQYHLKALLY